MNEQDNWEFKEEELKAQGRWRPIGEPSAKDRQEGGNHYKGLKIQPMEFTMANGLDPMQHTIIKYVVRFRDKNGLEDLRKAKHTLSMLIEWEEKYGKDGYE